MPKEKKSAYSAISSARMQARGSSIIVPTRYSTVSLSSLRGRDRDRAQTVQLLGEADERVHDLDERRLARALLDGRPPRG